MRGLGEALGLPELALGGAPGAGRGAEAARRGAAAGPNAPPPPPPPPPLPGAAAPGRRLGALWGLGWRAGAAGGAVGAGGADYRRAVAALRSWEQTDIGWVRVQRGGEHLSEGAPVCIEARLLPGLWVLLPLAVSSVGRPRTGRLRQGPTRGGGRRWGFTHRTVGRHLLAGEESFAVAWDGSPSGAVEFEVSSVARPAHPLASLGAPFVRAFQWKFRRDVAHRMRRAVQEAR